MARADVGVIGLGVMGRNLAFNAESRGYAVAVFNRTAERTKAFVSEHSDRRIVAAYGLAEFVEALARPRVLLIMVKAGPATDDVLSDLLPLLDRGDVVIDGGNAHYADTERRIELVSGLGVHYLGAGVSGGAHGALHGPSIMVGGSEEAYHRAVEPILTAIAARGPQGPCCALLGAGSAGHYVKMVHNGIEYAILQALAEAYDLMKRGLALSPEEMADVFGEWSRGDLGGYLVEITEKILRRVDPETGNPLVESILDVAAQKGTGKWSSQSALDLGSPAPTIAAAVFSRVLSSLKNERVEAERSLGGPAAPAGGLMIDDLHDATLLTVVSAYAQGLRQLRDASAEREYGLDLAEVARVWMGGCVIRARLLDPIRNAFTREPDLPFLMLAEPFCTMWEDHQAGLRRAAVYAHQRGFPVPAIGSVLNALDSYRTGRLPANLIQAQRDFFGAHTYRRIDQDGSFHTEWESVE
jgi:6-phosphogluconate dehydrogenase